MIQTADIISNSALICAKAANEPVFSHEAFGIKFYGFDAVCERRSEKKDIIRCIAAQDVIGEVDTDKHKIYCGQIRSHNAIIDGNGRLLINVFVKAVSDEVTDMTANEIILCGFICKRPAYRVTPFGREIADMLVAVNRSFGRSDYIPVIAWGQNARRAGKMEVGQRVYAEGRLQSREYEKRLADGSTVKRTAYEVSAYALV